MSDILQDVIQWPNQSMKMAITNHIPLSEFRSMDEVYDVMQPWNLLNGKVLAETASNGDWLSSAELKRFALLFNKKYTFRRKENEEEEEKLLWKHLNGLSPSRKFQFAVACGNLMKQRGKRDKSIEFYLHSNPEKLNYKIAKIMSGQVPFEECRNVQAQIQWLCLTLCNDFQIQIQNISKACCLQLESKIKIIDLGCSPFYNMGCLVEINRDMVKNTLLTFESEHNIIARVPQHIQERLPSDWFFKKAIMTGDCRKSCEEIVKSYIEVIEQKSSIWDVERLSRIESDVYYAMSRNQTPWNSLHRVKLMFWLHESETKMNDIITEIEKIPTLIRHEGYQYIIERCEKEVQIPFQFQVPFQSQLLQRFENALKQKQELINQIFEGM